MEQLDMVMSDYDARDIENIKKLVKSLLTYRLYAEPIKLPTIEFCFFKEAFVDRIRKLYKTCAPSHVVWTQMCYLLPFYMAMDPQDKEIIQRETPNEIKWVLDECRFWLEITGPVLENTIYVKRLLLSRTEVYYQHVHQMKYYDDVLSFSDTKAIKKELIKEKGKPVA